MAGIKFRNSIECNFSGILRTANGELTTCVCLEILSSKNNLVAVCEIYEAFPISIGSIEYSQQETDLTYATCDISFAYTWFDVRATST